MKKQKEESNEKQISLCCPKCGYVWKPGHMNWISFKCIGCNEEIELEKWHKINVN